MICEYCEKEPASKYVLVLASDPLVALNVCVICWLRLEKVGPFRIIEDNENVNEVMRNLEE